MKFKGMTLRNFMSVGAVTQSIDLTNEDLVLILGENLDLGGGNNRNGVGKTVIINALSYVLFGQALTKIKQGNLVNKTNEKAMLVTLDFEKGGREYHVERGRKPNIFKVVVDGVDIDDSENNEAQGDSRETQKHLGEVALGFSHDMFRNIIALNTSNVPFLSMTANDQRGIIEQLLGVTQLSEKADALKILIKETKDNLKEEEFRINALIEANKQVESNIKTTTMKSNVWEKSKETKMTESAEAIAQLQNIDIDGEFVIHKEHADYAELVNSTNIVGEGLAELEAENLESEKYILQCKGEYADVDSIAKTARNKIVQLEKDMVRDERLIVTNTGTIENLNIELEAIEHSNCPTCNQHVEGDTHETLKADVLSKISASEDTISHCTEALGLARKDIEAAHAAIEGTVDELDRIGTEIDINGASISGNNGKIAKINAKVAEAKAELAAAKPTSVPFYKDIADAYNHKSTIDMLEQALKTEMDTVNPYTDQLQMLADSIKEVTYDVINDLTSKKDHQDFLLKLLTSKDSFIRKKIIEQNLAFLNSRLSHYLDTIGLPHVVKFMPNLEVEISELGRDLDFDNLSRGERTRLILSLSWAFRDVYENLNEKINIMFIDELLDNGMDGSGVDSSLVALKQMIRDTNRDVFLVSHKEEIIPRVNTILKVTKNNGFTEFSLGSGI